jgi:hypothetical protein
MTEFPSRGRSSSVEFVESEQPWLEAGLPASVTRGFIWDGTLSPSEGREAISRSPAFHVVAPKHWAILVGLNHARALSGPELEIGP